LDHQWQREESSLWIIQTLAKKEEDESRSLGSESLWIHAGTVPDILQERNLSSLVARPFRWCSRGFTKTWWVKLLTLSNCQARRRIFVPDIPAIFVIIVDIFVIGAFFSYWMCALVTDISNPITARCRFLLLLVHHRWPGSEWSSCLWLGGGQFVFEFVCLICFSLVWPLKLNVFVFSHEFGLWERRQEATAVSVMYSNRLLHSGKRCNSKHHHGGSMEPWLCNVKQAKRVTHPLSGCASGLFLLCQKSTVSLHCQRFVCGCALHNADFRCYLVWPQRDGNRCYWLLRFLGESQVLEV